MNLKHKIGVRLNRENAIVFLKYSSVQPRFVEILAEEWQNIGGYWNNILEKLASRYKLYVRSEELNLGGLGELNMDKLISLKKFLSTYDIKILSGNIGFTSCKGFHTYTSMPIEYSSETLTNVAKRVNYIQNLLEQYIVIEPLVQLNKMQNSIDETTFFNQLTKKTGCSYALNIESVFLNEDLKTENFDFKTFLPLKNIAFIHLNQQLINNDNSNILGFYEKVLRELKPLPIIIDTCFNSEFTLSISEDLQLIDVLTSNIWKSHAKQRNYKIANSDSQAMLWK